MLDSNIIPAFVCLLMCNLHLPKCFTSETTRRQKFNKTRAENVFQPTVSDIHSYYIQYSFAIYSYSIVMGVLSAYSACH